MVIWGDGYRGWGFLLFGYGLLLDYLFGDKDGLRGSLLIPLCCEL